MQQDWSVRLIHRRCISGVCFYSYSQTMATPLTVKLLHWGELENSLMYCAGGVEVSSCVGVEVKCITSPLLAGSFCVRSTPYRLG